MIPACLFCEHFIGDVGFDEVNLGTIFACKAFPKGIPATYFQGRAFHVKPHPADGGLRYKPNRDPAAPSLEEARRAAAEDVPGDSGERWPP